MAADETRTAGVKAVDVNQCDGCRQGAPLRGDLHIDKDGHAFMACQRERYAAGVKASDEGQG